jgi:hypothetical protein
MIGATVVSLATPMTALTTAAIHLLADTQNDTFWHRWVWPAGGSGGTPGDVVGTLIWVVIAAIVVRLLWNPVKRLIRNHVDVDLEYLHRKLDAHADLLEHIIRHHPDIPDHHVDVPRGAPNHHELHAQAKARASAAKARAKTTGGAPTNGAGAAAAGPHHTDKATAGSAEAQ